MEAKEKAVELVDKFISEGCLFANAKKCAIICVENEYNALREQLFNLRACGVIESSETYLKRIQYLIDEEAQVKHEIQQL